MTTSDPRVTAEYLKKAAELTRQVKQRSYDLMHILTGAHLLDVGCGPGIDTVSLARLAGGDGSVVGVDSDRDMLARADAAARENGVQQNVQHRYGDVSGLPFEDGMFDACRAERLLQVLPDSYNPQAVLAEMIRVVKRSGRVVIADSDWATASVDFSDPVLERRLLTFFADKIRPNGYAGRQLYGLFRRSGLSDLTCEVIPIVQTQLSQTPFGDWLQEEALKAGIASVSELRAWRDELDKRSEKNEFFGCVNMVVAAGKKP
jgi:ubiquinone/menaquinone biosynthesis C-methylase UbiE